MPLGGGEDILTVYSGCLGLQGYFALYSFCLTRDSGFVLNLKISVDQNNSCNYDNQIRKVATEKSRIPIARNDCPAIGL